MPRIDSNVASQLPDLNRPLQQDRQVQQIRSQTFHEQQAKAGDGAAEAVPADSLHAAVAQVKKVVEAASGKQLQFDFDQDARELTVTVRDQSTGQVIIQIPTKEIMEMHKRINALVGMMLDKHA